MRLKAHAPEMMGWVGQARIPTRAWELLYGPARLIIEGPDGGPVSPAEAALADYEVLEATEDEIWALIDAGYEMRGMNRI